MNDDGLTVTTEDGVETYTRSEVEAFWNEWHANPNTDKVPATLVGIFSDPRISGQ